MNIWAQRRLTSSLRTGKSDGYVNNGELQGQNHKKFG
jgi:hypothetical protein